MLMSEDRSEIQSSFFESVDKREIDVMHFVRNLILMNNNLAQFSTARDHSHDQYMVIL